MGWQASSDRSMQAFLLLGFRSPQAIAESWNIVPMAQSDPQRHRDAASSGKGQSSAPRRGKDLSAGWRSGSSAARPGHVVGVTLLSSQPGHPPMRIPHAPGGMSP